MGGILVAFASAALASAQTAPPDETLPQITVGVGPSWTRGDVHTASADVDIAVRLGSTNAYSWSTLSTPIARVPAGAPALASTVTTGAAYIIARSASGRISLLAIAQAGINSTPSSASLAVTGSAGMPIRLWRSNLYLMPYLKASKPERGTDGNLISAIVQPGVMLVYGFGGAK